MFDFIAGIFKYPMMWFYSWTNSYLLSLILFALLVKIVFLPLSIHQQKTQIKGAKLRPKIALIEKKYAGRNDPDSLREKQNEIMEFQQKEGYSPMAGCLPLLLQFPIIIGLYQVIRKPLSFLVNASNDLITALCNAVNNAYGTTYAVTDADQIGIIGTIREKGFDWASVTTESGEHLAFMPDLTIFGGSVNLGNWPDIGRFDWLLLIPVLTFALAYLSIRITRKLNTPVMTAQQTPEMMASNRIMDIAMPLMSLFFTFSVPAAVGIYWLVGYVFGILQTVVLAKLMPLPTFTEEEIRQFEKEMKAYRSRSKKAAHDAARGRTYKNGTIRSLHHIDDDDEPTPAPAKKGGAKKGEKAPAAPDAPADVTKAPADTTAEVPTETADDTTAAETAPEAESAQAPAEQPEGTAGIAPAPLKDDSDRA